MSDKETYPKPFPILLNALEKERGFWPKSVSWQCLNEGVAKKNHGGQSLEILAKRGGLSPYELYAVLNDCTYYDVCGIHENVVLAKLKSIEL